MAVVASPLLIYMASASPPPSPNHSPSVSVVVFVAVRHYHRLPPLSPMHCLIVVLLKLWSSIVHRPLSIVSISRPLFAVRHCVISLSATSLPWHHCHHQIVDYCLHGLMAVVLVVLHVCRNGSIVVFIIIVIMSIVVIDVILVAHPHRLLLRLSPPLHHVTLGEGVRERAYNLNRIW